jgi:hypothetical protein
MGLKVVWTILLSLFLLSGLAGCSGGGQQPVATGGGATDDNTASASGGLTMEQLDEIERVKRIGHAAIVECYTDELERRGNKELEGKVTVEIRIGTNRRALSVGINQSTLKAPKVHACIQNVIKTWEFPRLSAPADYGATFAFSPAY